MSVLWVLATVLSFLLFFVIVIYSSWIFFRNRKGIKLYFKSSFNSIKFKPLAYSFLVLFLTITIVFTLGSTLAIFNFSENNSYTQINDLYHMTSIDIGDSMPNKHDSGTPNDPTDDYYLDEGGISDFNYKGEVDLNYLENTYPEIYPDQAEYLNSDGIIVNPFADLFYLFEYLNQNYNNEENGIGGEFLFRLDIKINVYTSPYKENITGEEIVSDSDDVNYNSDLVQIVRISDSKKSNEYLHNDSYFYLSNPTNSSNYQKIEYGDNYISDGEVYVNQPYADKYSYQEGDNVQFWFPSNNSTAVEITNSLIPGLQTSNLEIGGYVNPYEFLFPSIENTISSQKSRIDDQEQLDPVIYLNQDNFDEIWRYLDYLGFDYEINMSFKIAYESVLDKIFFSDFLDYNNFEKEIESLNALMLEGISSNFTKNSDEITNNTNLAVFSIFDQRYTPNSNSLYLESSFNNYRNLAVFVSATLIIILLIVVFMMIVRTTKNTIKTLGTLKALGINRKIIELSSTFYVGFALIISMIIGGSLAPAFSGVWNNLLYSTFYVPNEIQSTIIPFMIGLFFILMSSLWLISYLITKFMINRPALKQLKNESNNKPNYLVKSVDKVSFGENLFLLSYGIKNIFRSTTKSLFAFIIIVASLVLIGFSFSASRVVETSTEKTLASVKFNPLSLITSNDVKYMSNEDFLESADQILIYNEESSPENIIDTEDFYTWYESSVSPNLSNTINQYSYISKNQIDSYIETLNNLLNTDNDPSNDISDNKTNREIYNIYSALEDSFSAPLNSKFAEFSYFTYLVSNVNSTGSNPLQNAWNNPSTIGVTFGVQTYNPEYTIPANLRLTEKMYNSQGQVYSKSTTIPTLIADTSELNRYIYLENSDTGKNYIDDINELPDITNGTTYIDQNGNQKSCSVTSPCVNAVVDAGSALNYGIEVGDVLTIDLNDGTTPSPNMDTVSVYISGIGLSVVPFGLIINEESEAISSLFTEDSTYSDHYNFLAGLDAEGDYGLSVNVLKDGFSIDSGKRINQLLTEGVFGYSGISPVASISIPIQSLVVPIVEENFESIDSAIKILMAIVLVVTIILISIIIIEIINETKNEANVLKSQGYGTLKIVFVTLSGYLILFLVGYFISIPLLIIFLASLNGSIFSANVSSVSFQLGASQILYLLGLIMILSFLIVILARSIYGNMNPAKTLKKSSN